MEATPVDLAGDPSEPVGFWEEADPKHVEPMGLWDAWWSGAIRGSRRAAFWISPFVAMMLLPGLALIHFGLGTGHGFGLPNLVLESLEVLAAVGATGAVIGGILGGLAAARAGSDHSKPAPGWWAALNRPVTIGPMKRTDSPEGATTPSGFRPSVMAPAWFGAQGTFWIIAGISEFIIALMAIVKSLGLAGALRMNENEIGKMPHPALLAVAMVGVSAMYALVLGAPAGFMVGVLRWGWWRLKGRPDWSRQARRTAWFRRSREPRMTGARASKRRFLRPAPFLLGLLVQLIMVGSVGLGVYAAWRVHQRLEEAMAVAEIDDPSWRLDDLMARRERVPYTENAAVVVAEALELIPRKWPPLAPPNSRSPQTPEEELGAAFSRLGSMPENLGLNEATARAIEAEVDRLREAIQIARTLVHHDRGRHELIIGPTVIDTQLPETQATRNAARLLTLDSALRADRGDLDGALESCRASVVAGRSIGDEPFMISQLVRIAIGSYTMQATRRVLGQGEPSDAALARIQSLILDERDQPLLLYAVRGERAQMDELIRRIRDGEVPIEALSNESWRPDGSDSRFTVAPWARLSFDYQRALELELMNDAVSIAEAPPEERPAMWQAWDQRIRSIRQQWHSSVTSVLPMLMTPALMAGGLAHARYQAELGAMAILLAAERHRRRNGAWPALVAAIDASILPDPPLDPFTGQPYHVEHRDGRLFVYSVGPNLRDEHGDYNVRKWGTRNSDQDDVGAIGWDVELRGLVEVDEEDVNEGDPPVRRSG